MKGVSNVISRSAYSDVDFFVEEIVKRGKLTLKARSLKYLVLMLLAIPFAAIGIVFIFDGFLIGFADYVVSIKSF